MQTDHGTRQRFFGNHPSRRRVQHAELVDQRMVERDSSRGHVVQLCLRQACQDGRDLRNGRRRRELHRLLAPRLELSERRHGHIPARTFFHRRPERAEAEKLCAEVLHVARVAKHVDHAAEPGQGELLVCRRAHGKQVVADRGGLRQDLGNKKRNIICFTEVILLTRPSNLAKVWTTRERVDRKGKGVSELGRFVSNAHQGGTQSGEHICGGAIGDVIRHF